MNEQMKVRVLQESDTEECLKLLAHSFCQYDPMELILGITEDEFVEMVQPDLELIFQSRLSLCLRDQHTQELVAVCIVVDSQADFADTSEVISKKFRPIAAIVNELHHPYLKDQNYSYGELAYIYMGSVSQGFQGKGIATSMFAEIEHYLREKNYQKIFTITTNQGSYKALNRNGFFDVGSFLYRDFFYQGKACFSEIKDHPGLVLMEKELS